MSDNEIKKKIKGQKNAAIILIIGPMIGLMLYFKNNNFEIVNRNGYVFVCSLIIITRCAV